VCVCVCARARVCVCVCARARVCVCVRRSVSALTIGSCVLCEDGGGVLTLAVLFIGLPLMAMNNHKRNPYINASNRAPALPCAA